MMTEWSAVAIVFLVFPLPFLCAFGIVAYRLWMRHRQVQAMLEERRLLIERGVTDLPPMQLPDMARKRDRLANLTAGVVLLFLGAALWLMAVVAREPLMGAHQVQIAAMLAAIGVALLIVHAIAEYYRRSNGQLEQAAAQAGEPQEDAEEVPQDA